MTTAMIPQALSMDTLAKIAPAVFADAPAQHTSGKFQFIRTAEVVAGLRHEGFVPVRAKQTGGRRSAVARHMIVFRLPDQPATQQGDLVPEIVLFNAHDGTSSYRLHAGIFRLVCANGLLVADTNLGGMRVPHIGAGTVERVLEGTEGLVRSLPQVLAQVDYWKATDLSGDQRLAFAERALRLRFPKGDAPIAPQKLLAPRRLADRSTDLFTTMNVVQENLLRGGQRGRKADGSRTTTRNIGAIDAMTRLNLKLWELTAEYSQN